jgi:hypothetical protein
MRHIADTVDHPIAVAMLVTVHVRHDAEPSNLIFDTRASGNPAEVESRMGIMLHDHTRRSPLLWGAINQFHAGKEMTERDDRRIIRFGQMGFVQL